MKTTMGQLIAVLFERFEREYGDKRRAAAATQQRIQELLTPPARARHVAR
jgi:hypothetical protein